MTRKKVLIYVVKWLFIIILWHVVQMAILTSLVFLDLGFIFLEGVGPYILIIVIPIVTGGIVIGFLGGKWARGHKNTGYIISIILAVVHSVWGIAILLKDYSVLLKLRDVQPQNKSITILLYMLSILLGLAGMVLVSGTIYKKLNSINCQDGIRS